MLKFVKTRIFHVLAGIYSLLVALAWLALRPNWSGISQALGAEKNTTFFVMQLPAMVCAFLWICFGLSVFSLIRSKKLLPAFCFTGISIVFSGAIAAILALGGWDYLPFSLPYFYRSLAVSAAVIAFSLIICFPPEKSRSKIIIIALAAAAVPFAVFGVRPNFISCDAVVYAVEDSYQIVFSTSRNSGAWVKIGDETYYDLSAGSLRTASRVHKITVPQSALDSAGEYTVFAQTMIYRGPFGGYKGRTLSSEHSFRPVNTADGFSYYALSDVHDSLSAAVSAASAQENLDLLVLLGDISSMIEREKDAMRANNLASAITNGEYPVVYARGNHETKGNAAEELYRCVGAKGEDFYYTFTLGDIFGIVLDMGEDHTDDWWEFYGTAKYDVYRARQTEFLQEIAAKSEYRDYAYRMVLCHDPVVFVNDRMDSMELKNEWTVLLNQMDVDIYLSGHQHKLNVFVPGEIVPGTELTYNPAYRESKIYGGCLTDFNFYGFIVSRCSNSQTGAAGKRGTAEFTGLRVDADLASGIQEARFTNARGETVPVCNIFGTKPAQEKFVF